MSVKVITATEIQFVVEVLSRVHTHIFDGATDEEDSDILADIDAAADILFAITKRPNKPIPETEDDG